MVRVDPSRRPKSLRLQISQKRGANATSSAAKSLIEEVENGAQPSISQRSFSFRSDSSPRFLFPPLPAASHLLQLWWNLPGRNATHFLLQILSVTSHISIAWGISGNSSLLLAAYSKSIRIQGGCNWMVREDIIEGDFCQCIHPPQPQHIDERLQGVLICWLYSHQCIGRRRITDW